MSTADLTLRIEHVSGDVSELVVPTPVQIDEDAVTLATIDISEAIDRVARCEAAVFRDSWLDVTEKLDRRNDELYVSDDEGNDIFGGRLDDWQFNGTLVSVQIDSWERDALDAEPPESFDATDQSDAAIAESIINLMPDTLSLGVTEETTTSIDYRKTHAPPGVMLRELTQSTSAEVQYHPDGTIDYVNRRGVDRAETLSPSSGAVIGSPRIRRTMREEVTDVRAVSEDDATIYEEATAIPTGPGEKQVWEVDRIDSTSSSRLQARATRLANEFADEPEYLEVNTTLEPVALGSTPMVGDRYTLELPAYGVETAVRVIERDRTIDDNGDRVDVLLSNRKLTLRNR